jgi:nicotinate-nucleotide adenylyltransferase
MAIAIFGGSFDPPHAGHVAVVRRALQTLPITTLYVVPAYVNPFKSGTHAPAEMRLKWLERIFEDEARVTVSDFEIAEGRPVPTIETVQHFRQTDPSIYLIIGSDNLDSLGKWHNFETLDSLVTWVVATRRGHHAGGMLRSLDVDVDISSTELRALEKTHLIPDAVREEIENYYKDIQCKKD